MKRASSQANLHSSGSVNLHSSGSVIPDQSFCVPRCSFLDLHCKLYLALYSEEQVERIAQHALHSNYILLPLQPANVSPDDFDPSVINSSLEEIYRFDQMSQSAIHQNAGMKVVLYTGPGNAHQLKIIFLLGCHMIMTHGWSCDDALSAFKPLADLVHSACREGSVQSSWRALCWARERSWINFKETFDLGLNNHDCIQMDEYLHYARCAPPCLRAALRPNNANVPRGNNS